MHIVKRFLLRGGLFLASLITSLLLVEFGLTLTDYPPLYKQNEPIGQLEQATFWVCEEEVGCHYNPTEARVWAEARPNDFLVERLLTINAQGYPDTDDFTATTLPENAYKILVLGDSYTWGASADVGKSWVETLESGLQDGSEVVLWNTGIPTVGTLQALTLLKTYAPLMQPDLVILGFYHNDFDDNFFPLDAYYMREDGMLIRQYYLTPELKTVRLTPEAAYLWATGERVTHTESEKKLGQTRLGSGLLRLWYRYKYADGGEVIDKGYNPDDWQRPPNWDELYHAEAVRLTETYLTQIANYTRQNGIPLLVLVIPRAEDTVTVGQSYHDILGILDRQQVNRLEPLPLLTPKDYMPAPDTHWNNSGHQKAGEMLLECLLPIVQNQQPFERCPS